MRTIMVMFDTLTRKFLPNYGCDWVHMPNFSRLSQHCTRFDNFYVGSMPCMPARRELHTGKYNFLHRSWGPLEPFDHSVMEVLRENGIYTHLCTDHSHYWEDGGATYHNRYNTWEGFRGQEGDRYVPHDIDVELPADYHELNKKGLSVAQNFRNRIRQQREEEMPGSKTAQAGLEFLKEHVDSDNWFLQIERFDPHEPFHVPQKYRALYGLPEEETLCWPKYGMLPEGDYQQAIENSQKEYAALLTQCDVYLGKILDFMDEHDMWKDTALIVNTDHGFLIGEHDYMGKNCSPLYDEMVHIPFFIHVPGVVHKDSTDKLACTVDIVPTLLELFGLDLSPMGEMDGRSMMPILKEDTSIRDRALFGLHGFYTCCTDGRYVYMKASSDEENRPLCEYTLMPTNMRSFFSEEQLKAAKLVIGSRFTNGIPCLRMPVLKSRHNSYKMGDRLYDLYADPKEEHNLLNEENEVQWKQILKETLLCADAPEEEYIRLGL